ncbi:MAG: hypothetical protein ACKN81_07055 [Pirellulaceae bacterium]
MADARVTDVEALSRFQEQIGETRTALAAQVEAALQQMHRMTRWVEEEAPGYWTQQLVSAERRWTEAREALARCESRSRASDTPACSSERKTLHLWTERKKLCQAKLSLAKQTAIDWQRLMPELDRKIRSLDELVQSGLPQAHHRLGKILLPLRSYLSTSSPSNNSRASDGQRHESAGKPKAEATGEAS